MKVHEYFEECSNQIQTDEFTCGVEFEIEDILAIKTGLGNVMIETDDSLRNNGREIKTYPSSFDVTLERFDDIHKHLKLGDNPFSDRTSTHVHVNVSNLEVPQARQLVLTYALLEPVFFAWVGPERQNNIYCVPLNYTYLPNHYKNELAVLHQRWHKYTAFNILPMSTLGTVEFRHLYGTNDREVFVRWLSSLKELYTFIKDSPKFDIINALQEHETSELARTIIPSLANLYTTDELQTMMKDTQLDVKLSVGGLK